MTQRPAAAASLRLPSVVKARESPLDTRPRDARAAPRLAPDEFFTVHRWDARRLEMLLTRHSSRSRPLLMATVTSPPYAALKDYGHPDQIGYGQRPDEYRMEMRRVFRSVYRHTK